MTSKVITQGQIIMMQHLASSADHMHSSVFYAVRAVLFIFLCSFDPGPLIQPGPKGTARQLLQAAKLY
jgi:hypothetical protein